MVSKNVVVFCVMGLIFLLACQQKKPYFIKEQSKFLPLAADLYLMQVAMEQAPEPLRDSLFFVYQSDIKLRHGIDNSGIERFYEELAAYPQEAMIFYDSLSAYVSQKESVELQKSVNVTDEMQEN
jgi:hypothetical protein